MRLPYLPGARELVEKLVRFFLLHPAKEIRVRRFDLCADVAAIDFQRDDADAFVTKARGEVSFGVHEATVKGRKLELTGFAIGQKGDISARIYDKPRELRAKYAEDHQKLRREFARLHRAGWNGHESVWRLECQVRGDAIKQFKARDLWELDDLIDGVWAYCVGKPDNPKNSWLRLGVLDKATRRERCPLDPRWRLFQEAVFTTPSRPAVRERGRSGGVPVASALGAVLSCLGAHGALGGLDDLSAGDTLTECLSRFEKAVAAEPEFEERFPVQVESVAKKFSHVPDGEEEEPGEIEAAREPSNG